MNCSSQASLSFIISWSLLKLTTAELMMPSNHLIFCVTLPLLPSVFPSIRVFSSELESSHQVDKVENGSPLQYSCLENPMDRVVWLALADRATKNRTSLSN